MLFGAFVGIVTAILLVFFLFLFLLRHVTHLSCYWSKTDCLMEDDPMVKRVRKRIADSRPRDPIRSVSIHWRMFAGAIVTISVMLSFAWIGDFLLGDAGGVAGAFIGFWLGLWLPPHLHEHD